MRSILFLLTIILLSACSDTSTTLYKQESPLEIQMEIPTIVKNQEATIQLTLMQDGKKVTNANFVHLEVIKQDGNKNYGMSEMTNEGDGIYSKRITLSSDGLYFITIHAGNNQSIITPSQRVIVGQLTENDILFLHKDTPSVEINHEGHH